MWSPSDVKGTRYRVRGVEANPPEQGVRPRVTQETPPRRAGILRRSFRCERAELLAAVAETPREHTDQARADGAHERGGGERDHARAAVDRAGDVQRRVDDEREGDRVVARVAVDD